MVPTHLRWLWQSIIVGGVIFAAGCGGGGGGTAPTTSPTITPSSAPSTSPSTSPTPTAAPSPGTLFVATAATAGPVAAYAAASTGTPAPLYTLSSSGLSTPVSMAEDGSGNLYVLNKNGGSILVYAKGATTPTRTITSTALVGPEVSIAADAAGDVYVLGNVNVGGTIGVTYGVAVFAAGSGANATPNETYTQTTPANVTGIAVDGSGAMYISAIFTNANNEILVFSPGASGNATPVRTITATQLGSATGLNGLAVDAAGDIYASVAQPSSNSIVEFAAGANGAATPTRTIAGTATLLSTPTSVALDAAGELLVQNAPSSASAYVTVYAAGATGNIAPIRTIGEQVGGTSMGGGAITAGP